jgi:hypothetical protein
MNKETQETHLFLVLEVISGRGAEVPSGPDTKNPTGIFFLTLMLLAKEYVM